MDTSYDNSAQALAAFRATPKFRCAEPQFRILNRSPASVTQPLEAALNQCADDLSSLVKGGARPAELETRIAVLLRFVEKPNDTEDREYFAYYVNQLGQCVGVNVGPLLNRWLYGNVLSTLLRVFNRG